MTTRVFQGGSAALASGASARVFQAGAAALITTVTTSSTPRVFQAGAACLVRVTPFVRILQYEPTQKMPSNSLPRKPVLY